MSNKKIHIGYQTIYIFYNDCAVGELIIDNFKTYAQNARRNLKIVFKWCRLISYKQCSKTVIPPTKLNHLYDEKKIIRYKTKELKYYYEG